MSEMKKALEEKYPVPEKLLPENVGKLIDERKALKKRKKIKLFTAVTSVAACCAIAVGVGVSSLDSKGPEADKSSGTTTTTATVILNDTIVEETVKENVTENFSSYDEIYSELSKLYENKQNNDIYYDEMTSELLDGQISEVLPPVSNNETLKGDAPDSNDFYETYEQVAGVNEADVVKTDGKFIYYINYKTLYVLNTDGELLSKLKTNASPNYKFEMFIKDNIIILTYVLTQSDVTYAQVYSVSDTGELKEEAIYSQSGILCTSRLIDDKLYLISYHDLKNLEKADIEAPESFVPSYNVNGEDFTVSTDCIYLNDTQDFEGYTVISGIDINNPEEAVSIKSVFGSYPQIYCSQKNIYLMSNFTKNESIEVGFGLTESFYSDYEFCKSCYITKLSLNDGEIGEVARVIADGNTLNQFSADEHEGYLRIALDRNGDNALYIYDENLNQVGFVGGMGINEQIKSVTFNGDTGYIVTFRQTDPLYTIDLSDPENPVVTDELKISGFSTHLRQFREGLMIGFGKEANESNGVVTGIKLSMFEADENGEQQEVSRVVISDDDEHFFGSSRATSNHKYLLINGEKNIIGFPFESHGDYMINDVYYDFGYDGGVYLIYTYTENGFELLNKIEVTSENARAIYIGDVIYIFSKRNIYLADISTGEIIKEITLS